MTTSSMIEKVAPLRSSRGTAVPAYGYWRVGDKVWNANPAPGEPVFWVCVTAGEPGTWVAHTLPMFGSATYDAPSIADGANETTTVTVTGAALGDFANAAFSLDTQGLVLDAQVTATDTVTVTLQNHTGGTVDLASGTLSARVDRAE